jgi:hypothetical protein
VSNDATLRFCDGKEKGAVIVVIAGTYLQHELPVEILGFFSGEAGKHKCGKD